MPKAYVMVPVRVQVVVHVQVEIREKTARADIADAAEEAALERILDRDLSRETINTATAKAESKWYELTTLSRRGPHRPDVFLGGI